MGDLFGGCLQIVFALIGGLLSLVVLAFGIGILVAMTAAAFPILIVVGFICILLFVFIV